MREAIRLFKNAKLQRRTLTVVTNSINSLVLPILNPVVSFLVVRLASITVWGEFVQALIVVQLATHVIAWGNKEYLLREFSLNPTQIARAWQTSLVTRLAVFALACGAIVVMGLPPPRALWIALWGLGLVLYQSCEVLILYRKDFVFATLVELGGLGVQVAAVAWFARRIDPDRLIVVFALATLLKASVFWVRYRRHTLIVTDSRAWLMGRFDARYFSLAFPFFLLGFSGLLQSRIDLYSVNFFLPKSEVGQYQVFMTFMIYLQSIAAFILAPFLKGLYRLSYRTMLGISAKLFAFGALLLAPGLSVVYGVLVGHYHFDLSLTFMLAGGLLALPIYFYLPIIYALYKAGSQSTVIKINLLGIGVNLLLSVILLPRVGMIGAVVAGATAQWVMFAGYLVQSRTIRETYAGAVPELP